MTTRAQRNEAIRLSDLWEMAVSAYRHDDSDVNRDAEQAAYDALIDHVEKSDLNYTSYDPRWVLTGRACHGNVLPVSRESPQEDIVITKNPPRLNQAGNRMPLLLDCSPMRVSLTKAGRPFEPKDWAIGALVTFELEGEIVHGQVWSQGQGTGTHWVVADGIAYLLGKTVNVLKVV